MNLTEAIDGAEAVIGRTLTTSEIERVGIMLDNNTGWNGILSTLNVSGERVVELAQSARAWEAERARQDEVQEGPSDQSSGE